MGRIKHNFGFLTTLLGYRHGYTLNSGSSIRVFFRSAAANAVITSPIAVS